MNQQPRIFQRTEHLKLQGANHFLASESCVMMEEQVSYSEVLSVDNNYAFMIQKTRQHNTTITENSKRMFSINFQLISITRKWIATYSH